MFFTELLKLFKELLKEELRYNERYNVSAVINTIDRCLE